MLLFQAWLDQKPYKEIYDGAIHEKVSPQRKHGIVAGRMYALLFEWGSMLGDVAVEWRVYLDQRTTLVPDVAFISDSRLAALSEPERERPRFAPDIVVEVRSPDDRESDVARKTELYLTAGASLVFNVDPEERTVRVTSPEGGEHTLRSSDIIEHAKFPGLKIPVAEIFAPLDRKRK